MNIIKVTTKEQLDKLYKDWSLTLEGRQLLYPVEELLEVILVGRETLDGQRPVFVELVELRLRRYLDYSHLRCLSFLVFVCLSGTPFSPQGTLHMMP